MSKNESKLTVYFDPPFWIGVYERVNDGNLEVSKITFGSEPKDYEVYDYLLKHWASLRFSPPVPASTAIIHTQNPKRVQRAIQDQLSKHGTSTKSQQALALQYEASKLERRKRSHQEKEERSAHQFALRQKKRKEKHRGH